MISRLILAVVVGVLTVLVCVLVGSLLITIPVAFAVTVGTFLKDYSALLGLLAALYYFFSGYRYFPKA